MYVLYCTSPYELYAQEKLHKYCWTDMWQLLRSWWTCSRVLAWLGTDWSWMCILHKAIREPSQNGSQWCKTLNKIGELCFSCYTRYSWMPLIPKEQDENEKTTGVTWTGQILCSIWWWLQGFANLSRFKLFINLWSRRRGASRRWRQILNSRHLKVQKVSNGKDHRAILTTYIVITRKMISENNRLSLRLHTCIYTMFTHERIGTQDCRILHNQHKLTYILSLQQHGQSQNYLSFSKMDRRKEKESTSLFLSSLHNQVMELAIICIIIKDLVTEYTPEPLFSW